MRVSAMATPSNRRTISSPSFGFTTTRPTRQVGTHILLQKPVIERFMYPRTLFHFISILIGWIVLLLG